MHVFIHMHLKMYTCSLASGNIQVYRAEVHIETFIYALINVYLYNYI